MKTGRIKEGYGIVQNEIMKSNIGVYSKVVYALLVSYTGKNIHCWPSINTMCKDLKVSKPTILKAIKELESNSLIIVTKRANKNGDYDSNKYQPLFLIEDFSVVNEVDYPSKLETQGVVNEVDTNTITFNTTNEYLNINEEFNNSSETDKNSISVEANLKTKKTSAHHRIISKFFDEMHDDFVFSPVHAKSVGLLRKNITALLKKHNRVADDQEVGDFALQLFDKLPSYYLDKDLAVINSKFNEIVLQIKNTTNGKPTGKQSTREAAAARFGS